MQAAFMNICRSSTGAGSQSRNPETVHQTGFPGLRYAAFGLRLLVFTVGTGLLAGCGSIEPWVKPYERAHLADPIMRFTPDPVSSAYINHVYQAREGARGAEGGHGGGCGCN